MIGNSAARIDYVSWRKPFFFVWIPENVSLFAAGMVQFALIWHLTTVTESAKVVALAAAIALLPRAVLNPFIGALVDRFSRRRIMLLARLAVACCSLALFLLVRNGTLAPHHVFLVLFVRATADTFHGKALMASTSLMVPDDRLTGIAAMSQAIFGAIMFVAPALGAALLKLSSIRSILAIDFAGALLAVIPLLIVSIPRPPRRERAAGDLLVSILAKDCIEGFRYLKRWPGALGMLTISAIINFVMQPYFGLIAVFVKKELHGGEFEFGFLGAAVGLGFVAGGVILSLWGGFRRKMMTSLMGILGAGLVVFLSGLMLGGGFYHYLILFFCAAVMMPLCMGPIQSLVQTTAPPDIQGRLFSIMESVSTGTAPVSLLLAGRIFESQGARCWYLCGGICAIATAIWGFLNRRTRDLGVV